MDGSAVKRSVSGRRPAGPLQRHVLPSRQRRTQARQREILAAALHCFATIGFAATTLADIRERAGASIGSIYHHFKSKEQLAAALYIEGLRDYQSEFLAEMGRQRRAAQAVRGIVRRHLQWVQAHPDLSRFLYEWRQAEFVLAREDAIKDLNEHFYQAAMVLWRRFADRNDLVALPMDLFIAILLGPSQEFCRHWLAGRAHTRIEDAAGILADAAWRSLRSVEPRSAK